LPFGSHSRHASSRRTASEGAANAKARRNVVSSERAWAVPAGEMVEIGFASLAAGFGAGAAGGAASCSSPAARARPAGVAASTSAALSHAQNSISST